VLVRMRRLPKLRFTFAVLAAPWMTAPAHADDSVAMVPPPGSMAPAADKPRAFTLGTQPAWYFLGGVTTGGTVVAHDRGGYVGGEASLVRLSRNGRFLGFYGDGYYDVGAGRTYATSGLEGGYKLIGVDGGLASRFGGDRPEWGATGRLFVSLGVVSFYGRYAYFADALGHSDEHVVQIGALVKLPFVVWGLP
jgi:hypothetical protein